MSQHSEHRDAPDVAALRPWLLDDGPDDQGEWPGYCPLHDDDNASASYNFDKAVWRCFAGCPDGVIQELIHTLEERGDAVGDTTVEAAGDNGGFSATVTDIRSRRKGKPAPLPSMNTVEGWHSALLASAEHLSALQARRGLTVETVQEYQLGWDEDEQAYTIPFGEDGRLVNLKHYRLDIGDHDKKTWGVYGHNQARLYPAPPEAEEHTVIISEGEMDTILLLQYGFNAVTGSGGADVWKPEWTGYFKDKRVFIVRDMDKPGMKGRDLVRRALEPVAAEVLYVELPYEVTEDGGKDVTDFWHDVGGEEFEHEFKELLLTAKRVGGHAKIDEEGLTDISVLDSMNVKMSDKSLRMRAQVVARAGDTRSYPSELEVRCLENKDALCNFCPMAAVGERVEPQGLRAVFEVKPGDPLIVPLSKRGNIKNIIRDKKKLLCNQIFIDALDNENVQTLGVRRAVDEQEESPVDSDDVNSVRKVLSSPDFEVMPNRTVNLVGRVVVDEDTRANEFVAWRVEDTESNLDKFTMTPEMHKRLQAFQPSNPKRPIQRCWDIAKDLSSNVTSIIGRLELHVAMDLVWHSVLRFRFDDTMLNKGWLEMMVAGDTRTGKSKIAQELSKHYGAGRAISAETASVAGLIGAAQQVGEEWTVTWGIIPLSDRRLVVIDETSGLTHEQIGAMSSVRSSGIAEINKVAGDVSRARTRLIWMGNPRSGMDMRSMGDGVNVVQDLLGKPEDIARLDFAMSVTNQDVSAEEINRHMQQRKHVFTSALCHELVMWAWSRKPHHVEWAKGAEREVLNKALELGRKYVEHPPLVQAANVREKIARMAVALAARTYSSPDGETLVVTKYHVRDVVRFLNHLYGNQSFGYRDRSRQWHERAIRAEGNKEFIRDYLAGDPPLQQFFEELQSVSFQPEQLERELNLDREASNGVISVFREKGMLLVADSVGRIQYRMSPELIELLRSMRDTRE